MKIFPEGGSRVQGIMARSSAAAAVISMALMLFLGFGMTRLTKKLHLPNVTAYIAVGVLLGPYCLDWIPGEIVSGMDFIADLALAFIAFGVGEFFRLPKLRLTGGRVILAVLVETGVVTVLVFSVCRVLLGLSMSLSVVLAALAAVTSPTSTVMTIRQTGASGSFVDVLLQTVAMDNVMALLVYSVAISLAVSWQAGGQAVELWQVLRPLGYNLLAAGLGTAFGFLLKLLMPKKRSTDNRLIISVSLLLSLCGVCAVLDVSPLLGCMAMGTVYINTTNDENLFRQLGYFSPPILLLFYVRSGLTFDLGALGAKVGGESLLGVTAVYFAARLLAKYGGAWVGSAAGRHGKTIRRYLGLALLPQAGVSIGLAAMGARAIGGTEGETLQTIVIAAGILFEIVGPVTAKESLTLSGACGDRLEELTHVELRDETGRKKTPVEILTERIAQIQKELPEHSYTPSAEEEAFEQAAAEQYEAMGMTRNRRLLRKR